MTSPKGMVRVPGACYRMGSSHFYPEERPVVEVEVGDLLVDEHPVTNAEFRRFVKATGYVTSAERPPDPEDFPGAEAADLVPGSLVFIPTDGPVPLDDWTRWWSFVPGAQWRHPQGATSSLHGLDRHPAVHITYDDASAYAAWVGKRLPTEAEWEHAARGGLQEATFAWGEDFTPRGKTMANTWRGRFPWENLSARGASGTTPVGSYPANGYGLVDVTGNVWEWTQSEWSPDHLTTDAEHRENYVPCCGPNSPQVLPEDARRVIKGGSHLCAPSYCLRYRPAARQGQTVRSSTSHIGFRLVCDIGDA